MEPDNLTQLSEELIERFEPGTELGMMFQQNSLYLDDQDGDDNEPDDVIIVHMDIRQPLRSLRKIVERKLGVELDGYKFYLQDSQELESHKNLVDQCVKGEGLVQINVQVQTTNERINIVDVLKPTEAALAALGIDDTSKDCEDDDKSDEISKSNEIPEKKAKLDINGPSSKSIEKPCLNWVLDSKFRKEQTRLKIPEDPLEWTVMHVKHWFQWAVREFELKNVNIADWSISGKDLCALTHLEFRRKIDTDPGNVFWTHLQLLKECKFVSVVHKEAESLTQKSATTASEIAGTTPTQPKEYKIMRKTYLSKTMGGNTIERSINPHTTVIMSCTGVGSGNNGQVQLWQFLLDLLTDRFRTDIIQWVGTDGEFKLTDPERVARLWGEKKNKPAMNYEKLSRALRYYYDGDMISKVSGKRFAYKFDCDLKLLLGYTAGELSKLVNDKPYMDESAFLEDNLKSDEE